MNIFYLKWSFPLPHWLFDNIFYLKTEFLFFWACDGNLWKIMPISSIWKRDFRFFLACDGNLWKIISISSIWKRNFRVFSGLVMGTSFENGIFVSFLAFLENNANIFYLKTGFPCFFWACDGNLLKIIPISSIWKRDRSGTRPKVLLHSPLRGVTRVWSSMFYWFYLKTLQKITKNGSGTKDFQIDDIANIIPMLMVAKCKSSSKDQQSNSNPFNIGMIFAISSIWKLFFMHLGSVELMGLQMNIFYLKTILWNSLGSLMKYYLLFEKCVSVLLEYLLFEK